MIFLYIYLGGAALILIGSLIWAGGGEPGEMRGMGLAAVPFIMVLWPLLPFIYLYMKFISKEWDG